MHDTIAFAGLGTAAGAYVAMNGAADPHVTVAGTQIMVNKYNKILGSFACPGAACTGARLQSPSLRRTNPLYITPFPLAITLGLNPEVQYHFESPIELEPYEPLTCERFDGAASEHSAVIHMGEGAQSPVNGNIRSVRFATTITTVLHAWTNSTITFADALDNGDYDIVGARLIGANIVAGRFVLNGEAHRPGFACTSAENGNDVKLQRYGGMGVWGTFNTMTPPTIDILTSAAAGPVTFQGYLDLIKK